MDNHYVDHRGGLAQRFSDTDAAHFQPEVSFAWMSQGEHNEEGCCYHNAATCPDCGTGMVRLGTCFSCPCCGWGSCS